jgi:hypothetical protein
MYQQSEVVNKVEIERLIVISSKPFDLVVEALKADVGHPDMTPDLTLRSPYWSMSCLMACIWRMTRWQVCWPPIETRTLSPSPAILTQKSRTFFGSLQFYDFAVLLVKQSMDYETVLFF